MSITKQSAWTIFKAVSLGQPEGEQALLRLSALEFEAYTGLKEDFEMEVAKVGIEAQNEAAALTENQPAIEALEGKRLVDFVAQDYISMVKLFEGSKYERLHLTALFRISNTPLMLELAAPQS